MRTIIRKWQMMLGLLLMLPLLMHSQNTAPYQAAKPKAGEGLYSFLIRHQLEPGEHLQAFLELNRTRLGANNTLLKDQSYFLPPLKTELYEPLYGKERERFPLESRHLKGSCFYLVAGHGGPDPGAIGKYKTHELHEDEYAYDITLRLAKKLQENGARVHIIIQDPEDGIRDNKILANNNQETCIQQAIPLDQNQRLKQRTEAVNAAFQQDTEAYRRCLIIHLDSRSKRKQIDVFFYHHQRSNSGKKLALELRNTFDDKYQQHQPSRGFSGTVSQRNLYLLRNTTPVSVFIELGNMQNYRDQQRFIIADNRQALANWLYDGIKKDFERYNKK